MNFLRIFTRKPQQTSCSEAGRKGAEIRNTKERERKLAKARLLRSELGMPADPRLGA